MEPLKPKGKPPLPPVVVPPAAPSAAMVNPNVPHVPLTPMMDFLQRRLEAMEMDLAIERERSHAAHSMLQQQEGLKSQVEEQLKLMSDSLRREKSERENEEAKSHARGRIDSLEKRLDEMHQSWVALLRDAMAQRESSHSAVSASQETIAREQAGFRSEQAALKQDLGSLEKTISGLTDQMAQWRAESRAMAEVLPEIRALSERLSGDGPRLENQVGQSLARLTTELLDRLGTWERRQSLELEKQAERVQAFAREKATLLKSIEEQHHLARQEMLKERAADDKQNGANVGEIKQRIGELRAEAADNREVLARLLEVLTTPPKAKDKIIEGLEAEKTELARALQSRDASLQSLLAQHREAETTMSQSLEEQTRDSIDAKNRLRLLEVRSAEFELDRGRLSDEIESLKRQLKDSEDYRQSLEAERDQAAKSMLGEADRARMLIDERMRSDEAWALKLTELQGRLVAENTAKSTEASAVADLRSQLATLSEHLANALKQRDDAIRSNGSWEKDRADLLKRLKEKEEMINMLNSTFQKFLKP